VGKVIIEIQDEILHQATEIIEELGLDVESSIRVFLKRVVREHSLAFVLSNSTGNGISNQVAEGRVLKAEAPKIDRGEMRKSLAMKMFRERGKYIDRNITYSSKNRTTYNYWANPDFAALEEDWTLILNDWVNRKLYLFRIPAKTISAQDLVARNDKPNLIDIQILDDNPSFIDKRSDYSFKRFLVDNIDY
jgi:antitoxin component of RelBE/YafQ-DinJ toxin-antitoxin module